MNEYERGLESLAKWSQRKIAGKTALMHKRIKDVTEMYAEEERAVIRECQDTAAKFGVSTENANGMAQILRLVLGSRHIDTAEPAELPFEGPADESNGQMGDGGTRPDQGDAGECGATRPASGEVVGGVPVGPGQDESVTPARGKRSRGQAR